jgi:carboxyl-terminal processing protease
MRQKLKGLMYGVVAGFLCTMIVGMVVNRNLALEGTYTYLKLFNEVLSLVRNAYVDEVGTVPLMRGAYDGMLSELDPFSEYLNEEDHAAWVVYHQKGGANAPGPDAGLRVARKEGVLQVVSVKPGSAAAAKGITPGDRIRKIGEGGSFDLSVFKAQSQLAGKAGGTVAISVLRRDEPRKIDDELTFGQTALPEASFQIADKTTGIGVITIPHFQSGAADQIARALARAQKARAGRLLIDLRGNAWGSIKEAVDAAALFTSGGVIARLKGRHGEGEELKSPRSGAGFTGTIAVLVDGSTAEAAELFAAALGDAGASLVGEPTFGVGAEQEALPLKDGGYLVLSVRKYVSPRGTAWHGKGLAPGTPMVVSQENMTWAERQKKQLEQAIEHLKGLAPSAGKGTESASAAPRTPGEPGS